MWSRNGSGITSSTSYTDAKRRHKGDPCKRGRHSGVVTSTGSCSDSCIRLSLSTDELSQREMTGMLWPPPSSVAPATAHGKGDRSLSLPRPGVHFRPYFPPPTNHPISLSRCKNLSSTASPRAAHWLGHSCPYEIPPSKSSSSVVFTLSRLKPRLPVDPANSRRRWSLSLLQH